MLKLLNTCFQVNLGILASYLGISKDMLKSIACSRRDWALRPLAEATRLFEALETDVPVEELAHVKVYLEQEQPQKLQRIQREIKRLECRLDHLQNELVYLQTRREHQLRGMHACIHLLQVESDPHKRHWLELRKKHLLQDLSKENGANTALLRAEIAGLSQQIEALKVIVSRPDL